MYITGLGHFCALPLFPSVLATVFPSTMLLLFLFTAIGVQAIHRCRALPEDLSFPNKTVLDHFNRSIDGRLMTAVPSGEFYQQRPGGCFDALWFDGNFRG